MTTTKMLIAEVVSDDLMKEIVAHMKEHIAGIQGLVGHSILAEEGGRMVILITDWSQSTGLPDIPLQQSLPAIHCRHSAHAGRRLRYQIVQQQERVRSVRESAHVVVIVNRSTRIPSPIRPMPRWECGPMAIDLRGTSTRTTAR